MNDKTRMTLFVKNLLFGLWEIATAATVAHVWNFSKDLFYRLTAVISLVGIIVVLVRSVQQSLNRNSKNGKE